MLRPEFTKQFKRDYKLMLRRGKNPSKLEAIIKLLCSEETLPEKYRDHTLVNSRNYRNVRECHIEPDWLLVYSIKTETKTLQLIRTGTHSDLF